MRLDEIVGQPRAVDVLERSLGSGRVHHAWVFHGPAGVGKCSTALAFARIILDPTSSTDLSGRFRPHQDSSVQNLIDAGTHPDLHLIRKELARFSEDRSTRSAKLVTIPKDVVETHLLRPAALAATLGGGLASKVFIVDEAELLDRFPTNAPVQNALLKTLEEPPAGTLIILVTSAEERLLPTIRSRCQRVSFQPLSRDDLDAWIVSRGIRLDPERREALLRYASGSPGRLLGALETGIDAWIEPLGALLSDCRAGRPPASAGVMLSGLIDDWAKRWVDSHDNASKDAANRAACAHMITLIGELTRHQLRSARTLGDEVMLSAEVRRIDALREAEGFVAAAVQPVFVFENLASRLARA